MMTISNKLLNLEPEQKKATLYKIYNVVFLMGVILVIVIVIAIGRILFYKNWNPIENLAEIIFWKWGFIIIAILILRLGGIIIGFI